MVVEVRRGVARRGPGKLVRAGEVGKIRVSYAWRIPVRRDRLPPPQPEACLTTSRASRCKGGTLIAEDVWTLKEHQQRLSSPDGYRPTPCPRCGEMQVHVHDYLERKPLGLTAVAVGIVRYICASPTCRATWRILPAFLARHLRWAWSAVARAVMSGPPAARAQDDEPAPEPAASLPQEASPPTGGNGPCLLPDDTGSASRTVPARTHQRWRGRLASKARQLVVLLASRGTAALRTLAEQLGLQATRDQLVAAYAHAFDVDVEMRGACVGALAHRLERGIRLM
jgi:hypothetical protein